MKLSFVLKHPNSWKVQRLVRRFGTYKRLLIAFSHKSPPHPAYARNPLLIRCLHIMFDDVNDKYWRYIFGNPSSTRLALLMGFNINSVDKNGTPFAWDMTYAWYMTYINRTIVKILLAAGANFNKTCNHNKLSCLSLIGFTKLPSVMYIVQQLLDAGADPNYRENDNTTPLHEAASYDNLEAIQLLLAAGADRTQTTTKNMERVYPYQLAHTPQVIALLKP